MKGECTCWLAYPNECVRKSNGKWKCVEEYVCVKDNKGIHSNGKTKCKKRSQEEVDICEWLLKPLRESDTE